VDVRKDGGLLRFCSIAYLRDFQGTQLTAQCGLDSVYFGMREAWQRQGFNLASEGSLPQLYSEVA
jgi:hypothetical protein